MHTPSITSKNEKNTLTPNTTDTAHVNLIKEQAKWWHNEKQQPLPVCLPGAFKPDGTKASGKEILIQGWPNLTLQETETLQLFNFKSNIAIVLKSPLVAVDLENNLSSKIACALLPESWTFTRDDFTTKILLTCTDTPPNIGKLKWKLPSNFENKLIFELLINSALNVPPSRHSSGAELMWGNYPSNPRAEIPYTDLITQLNYVAGIHLLCEVWDTCSTRHDLTGAIAGSMCHAKTSINTINKVLGVFLNVVKDEEKKDRERYIEDTIQRFINKEPVSGIPTLKELLGDDDLADKLIKWFNLGNQTPLLIIDNDKKTASIKRTLKLTRASDVQVEVVDWLWKGRLARKKLNLITGLPGLGKTLLALSMAAIVSRGGEWPDGGKCLPGQVLILSAEDDVTDTLTPRLMAAGANLKNIQFIEGVLEGNTEREFNLTDITALEEILIAYPDTTLIVIDPMSSFVDARTNSHNESEVRGLLAPVKKLMEKYAIALLMIMHPNKSSDQHAVHRTSGASAWTGVPRVTFMVVESFEDSDLRLMLPNKCNLSKNTPGLSYKVESTHVQGAGEMAVIKWQDAQIMMNANDYLQSKTKPSPMLDEAMDILDAYLKDGPKKAKDVLSYINGASPSKATFEKAKVAMGIISARKGGLGAEGAWEWSLPPID